MSENEMTLEQRFDKLDTIVSKMESGTISLDDSFSLYKEGLEEVKLANEMLDKVEKAMLKLDADGNLEDF